MGSGITFPWVFFNKFLGCDFFFNWKSCICSQCVWYSVHKLRFQFQTSYLHKQVHQLAPLSRPSDRFQQLLGNLYKRPPFWTMIKLNSGCQNTTKSVLLRHRIIGHLFLPALYSRKKYAFLPIYLWIKHHSYYLLHCEATCHRQSWSTQFKVVLQKDSTIFVRCTNNMARWMNLLDLGRSLDSDNDEFSVLESGEDVRVSVRDGDTLDLNVKGKSRNGLQSETQTKINTQPVSMSHSNVSRSENNG